MITMDRSHRWPINPCRFRWFWVTVTRGVQFFRRISARRPYVGTAWHRTTKFCTVGVFLGGQQRLIPRGGAPASPDIWDVLRNPQEYDINQILRDDQTR